MSSNVDMLALEIVEYIADGDPLPEVCSVCGDPVTQPGEEREAGKSYIADKLCVLEESSLGVSQSIIHYESDPRGDETDDEPDTEDLKHVSNAVADANAAAVNAVTRSVDVPTTPAPVGRLWNTHDALCETRRALVQTGRMIRQYDHSKATPKEITREHAPRLEETYDGPVLNLAVMLL